VKLRNVALWGFVVPEHKSVHPKNTIATCWNDISFLSSATGPDDSIQMGCGCNNRLWGGRSAGSEFN